jgi:dipeptidyl aminopeptidase/acylaminoacyl peptidase
LAPSWHGTGGLLDVSRDGRFAVISRLAQRGDNNLSLVFSDEGHGFRKAPNRVRSASAIVRWFD